MILIKLYGLLGEKANETELLPGLARTIRIDKSNINNVMDILEKLNIAEEEISHIFINNQYCGAGYNVRDGDRVGIGQLAGNLHLALESLNGGFAGFFDVK